MRRRLAAFAARFVASGILAAVAALVPRAASAQPTSKASEYSPYEKESIDFAVKSVKGTIDPAPEGKTIESVETVRLDVLERRDPLPDTIAGLDVRRTLNALHVTSKEYTIRREFLLKEGEPYQQVMVDETARNIRSGQPFQISFVIIVPLKGSTPDKVRVLMITKDIWSLRLSYSLAVTPGGVETFVLAPQETNLLGMHHTVSTTFTYKPESYTLGVGYSIPRFGESWVGASAGASLSFNRRSGSPEGSAVSVSAGQGLYSTKTEWGYSGSAGYVVGVARRYVNAHLGGFDSQLTPEQELIPVQYKSRSASASVGVVRSFGWHFKNNFSLTMNGSTAAYDTFPFAAGVSPIAQQDFINRFVPVGETRVYPALTWATFTNDYMRTLDIQTLALQEDYRLGHDVSASVYPVLEALGSTRGVWGVSAKAGYSTAVGDGFIGGNVSTFAEVDDKSGVISDGAISGGFNIVTPRFGFGRVFMNTTATNRYENYLRSRSTLGGDDRLRGYPSNFFFGKDAIIYNLEYRSAPAELVIARPRDHKALLRLLVGVVAFYDVGDAADGLKNLHPKHSVGAGARVLIQQLNRAVLRFDFAVPLNRGPFPETGVTTPVDPFGFFIGFDQAF